MGFFNANKKGRYNCTTYGYNQYPPYRRTRDYQVTKELRRKHVRVRMKEKGTGISYYLFSFFSRKK